MLTKEFHEVISHEGIVSIVSWERLSRMWSIPGIPT